MVFNKWQSVERFVNETCKNMKKMDKINEAINVAKKHYFDYKQITPEQIEEFVKAL